MQVSRGHAAVAGEQLAVTLPVAALPVEHPTGLAFAEALLAEASGSEARVALIQAEM
jgi:hypothetical protein